MTFRCPTVWSTELCASVPRTVLVLLIETAKPLDSALFQTAFELRSFLPCSALFIPNRGIAIHLSLGPRPIIFFPFFFFNATPWHRAILLSRSATDLSATRWRLKKRETERHRSLGPRPILFFLTPPRGIERYYWLGPRPILVLFFFF